MCSRSVIETVVLVFVILGNLSDNLFSGVEGTVTCYVCSWSSLDSRNGSQVQDSCTGGNFQPGRSQKSDCDGGCETVAFKDSKQGLLRHFHRNCVDQTSGRYLKDRCLDIKGKIYYEEKCECLSNLCNSSPSGFPWLRNVQQSLIFPLTILVFSRVSFIPALSHHT